ADAARGAVAARPQIVLSGVGRQPRGRRRFRGPRPEPELRPVPRHPPVVPEPFPAGPLSRRRAALEPRRGRGRRTARGARAQRAAAEERRNAARRQLAARRSALPRRAREEVLAVPSPLAAAWLASCALALPPHPSGSLLMRSSAPPFSGVGMPVAAAPFDLA